MLSISPQRPRRPTGYGSHRRSTSFRVGAVAVEFALTAPILFVFVFASIELSHANMVLNVTESAAYAGAREGIVPGASATECTLAAEELLRVCGIRNATITVTPADLATESERVSVAISVPYASNTIMPPLFVRDLTVNRTCTLTREQM